MFNFGIQSAVECIDMDLQILIFISLLLCSKRIVNTLNNCIHIIFAFVFIPRSTFSSLTVHLPQGLAIRL